MKDADIAAQIAGYRDAAPEMAPEIDVRAIRRAAGMMQAQFAAAYAFSVQTVQAWERGREASERPGADAFARDQGRSGGAAAGVGGGLGFGTGAARRRISALRLGCIGWLPSAHCRGSALVGGQAISW